MHQKYKNNALVPCVRVEWCWKSALWTGIMGLQYWGKVLEHFVLTMVNCHPLSPSTILRTSNIFNSLPSCPNIVWWGKGKEEMKVIVSSITLRKKNTRRFEFGNFVYTLFSQKASNLVFQRLFIPQDCRVISPFTLPKTLPGHLQACFQVVVVFWRRWDDRPDLAANTYAWYHICVV